MRCRVFLPGIRGWRHYALKLLNLYFPFGKNGPDLELSAHRLYKAAAVQSQHKPRVLTVMPICGFRALRRSRRGKNELGRR